MSKKENWKIKHGKSSARVSVEMPEDLKESVETYGALVVQTRFLQQMRIEMRKHARDMLAAGKNPREIEHWLRVYKPDNKTTAEKRIIKTLKQLESLSPAELKVVNDMVVAKIKAEAKDEPKRKTVRGKSVESDG